jgi:hypothetical protein
MSVDPPIEIEDDDGNEKSLPSAQSPLHNPETEDLPRPPKPTPEVEDVEPLPEPPPEPVEPPAIAPDTPDNLFATVGKVSGQVSLIWDSSDETETYTVFWSDDLLTPINPIIPASYLGSLTVTGNAAVIGGLTDATPYHFVVLSKNVAGASVVSASLTSTPVTPPPPDVVTNLKTTVRIASGQVDVQFDEMPRATSYTLFWQDSSHYLMTVDPLDPLTFLGSATITTTEHTLTGLTDGERYWFSVIATGLHGDSAISARVQAVPAGGPPAPPSPENSDYFTWGAEAPPVSFLPLRFVDEEIGLMLHTQLSKISPVEEPKSLAGFLARERMIHWGQGDDPQMTIRNLYRTAGRTKVRLPLVVLYRSTAMESWDGETSVRPFMEQNPALLGFHPMRLNYQLMVIAFEQSVLDTLVMSLFVALKSQYRFEFPLKGPKFEMTVSGRLLDTESLTFSNELVSNEETRLYAARADFSLGTFSYHLPAGELDTLPVRFVFDSLRVAG